MIRFALRFFALPVTVALSAVTAAAAPPERKPLPAEASFPVAARASDMSLMIVGGVLSDDDRFVGLAIETPRGSFVCSGLYLATDWVVTAAHCLCGASRVLVTNKRFGDNAWVASRELHLYPGYRCSRGPSNGDDIGLVGLVRGLKASSGSSWKICAGYNLIGEIPLAGTLIRQPRATLTVAGYGWDGVAAAPDRKRVVDLHANTMLCAGQPWEALQCALPYEFILGAGASDIGRRDSCSGDSGGPVFYREGARLRPVGLVSRGLPVGQPYAGGDCGAGGIYTYLGRRRVLEWLRSHVGDAGGPSCAGTLNLDVQ